MVVTVLGALDNFEAGGGLAVDRRGNDRFPIMRELHYRVLGSKGGNKSGFGKTLDISSSGVLFASDAPLAPGKRVELSISWPAQLDGKCALKLVARGRVTRCRGTEIAVRMDRYEFRTQSSRGLAPRNGI
jgi:hypothetical protein